MAVAKPNWQLTVTPAGGLQEGDNAVKRTLESWGFQDGRLVFNSLAADTLELTAEGVAFDRDELIPFNASVSLRNPAGAVVFVGRRILAPGNASGPDERQTYTFAGPWWDLERLVYHQGWFNTAGPQFSNPHILINIGGASVATQIAAVIDYAIAQGANIARGTIEAPVVPPVSETADQSCAAVIQGQLVWAPDRVAWFDYSTGPPTFHCRPQGNLTAVNLGIPPDAKAALRAVTLIDIAPRPDDQVSAVAIRYETTSTVNGKEYFSVSNDVFPPGSTGRELRALAQTVALQGSNATVIEAEILCDTIDLASLDFWKKVIPSLKDDRIGSVNVPPLSIVPNSALRTGALNLPRFLIEGQLSDWMKIVTNDALQWEQDELSAKFNFTFYDENAAALAGQEFGKIKTAEGLRIPVKLVATNAPAGVSNYWRVTDFEDGDAQPVKLAEYLYNSLSPLGYEGSVQTTEQEATLLAGTPRMGNTLNLLGSRAEYASMAALIQSVAVNIDTGQTTIRFGVAPGLSISRIIELLRASRTRRRWTSSSVQTDGELSGSNQSVELGRATANTNSVPGEAQNKYLAVKDSINKISLDAALRRILIEQSGSATLVRIAPEDLTGVQKDARFRETLICEMIGGVPTQRRCWILRTVGE
jgi:hypothetical protein